MPNETTDLKDKVQAFMTSEASMKGLIREMDADELAQLKATQVNPYWIKYIDEQLRQLAGK